MLSPSRTESVANTFGQNYCKICQDGIDDAVSHVDRHVDPKDCFVWYKSNDNWEPIVGTGCAHWVSHQVGIHTGTGGEKCLAGFTYRVRPVVLSRMPVADISQVKVNDIWASPTLDHTGLVLSVTPPAKKGDAPTIVIRHDSSRQHMVADNDFASYFHGKGKFYR